MARSCLFPWRYDVLQEMGHTRTSTLHARVLAILPCALVAVMIKVVLRGAHLSRR